MRRHPLLGVVLIFGRSVDDAVRGLWGEEVAAALESAQGGRASAAYMQDDRDSSTTDTAEMYNNKDGVGRDVGWRRWWKIRTTGETQFYEDSGIIYAR